MERTKARDSPMVPSLRHPRHRRRAAAWGIVLLALLLVVAAAGVAAYFFINNKNKVPTFDVARGDVVEAFYATGIVRPDRAYTIKSKAQGALIQMPVREGQLVKKGDVLAQVDDKQLKFNVAKQEAEVKMAAAQAAEDSPQRLEVVARAAEARQQLDIATSMLQRTQSMVDKSIATTQELDESRKTQVQWSNTLTALESQLGTWRINSQKNLEVAQADLRRAQADLEDAVVRAPIDGLVLERYVELQEVVGINQQLFLLADPADKFMKAAVDEEYMTKVAQGQKVTMKLYALENELHGQVVRWLPSANVANKTYEVTIKFDEPTDKLLVGMTAELNFLVGQPHQGLVVPSTAVMDGKAWRVLAPGKYEPVEVTLGVRTLDRYEVLSGLKEGDEIVMDAKQVAPIKLPEAVKPIVPTRKGDKDE